jgi:hypothetical protein
MNLLVSDDDEGPDSHSFILSRIQRQSYKNCNDILFLVLVRHFLLT